MKDLKSTKSHVLLSLAFLIVVIGLIPSQGIFSGGIQSAKASDITEYGPTGSNPFAITSGPDGNIWFTQGANNAQIGKITTGGAITQYDVSSTSVLWDITPGPDGNLWF